MIPEIDIWRIAALMIKRYRHGAKANGDQRAEEFAANGDEAGAAVWRRITHAIEQLANTTPPGPPH